MLSSANSAMKSFSAADTSVGNLLPPTSDDGGSYDPSSSIHPSGHAARESSDTFDFGSIPTSEVNYLQDSILDEKRIAAESRVMAKLQTITNHSALDLDAFEEQLSEPPIKLTPEQARVHEMVVKDKMSIFFSGAAGTGKSILLKRIIRDLRQTRHGDVAVTASTGIAACAIGGRTVHSWAGIGLGNGSTDDLIKKIKRQKSTMERWTSAKVLIIDEVSMLSPELLDKLDSMAKKLRKNIRPFGGIQLILTGDFFQLPPVDKDSMNGAKRKYAFNAKCWKDVVQRTILLTQVFRQTDAKFQNMLNELRYSQASNETVKEFQKLSRQPDVPEGITPTRLYARRFEVEKANIDSLKRIDAPEVKFKAHDQSYPREPPLPIVNPATVSWIAPDEVTLKVGAQVMMIKNHDSTLVNGSIGRILAWVGTPPPQLLDKDVKNRCVIDLAYIKNRLLSQSTATLERFENSLNRVGTGDDYLPLVRFFNRDNTFRDVIIQPETWNYEDEKGEIVASRSQIPLILAYALSVHKSQGQTLDFVMVDMRSIFEVGQAYVALSRATSLDGLQVIGFNKNKVWTDPDVISFYDSLERFKCTGQQTVQYLFNKRQEPERSEQDEDPLAYKTESLRKYMRRHDMDPAPPPPDLSADFLSFNVEYPSMEQSIDVKAEASSGATPSSSRPRPPSYDPYFDDEYISYEEARAVKYRNSS